MNAHGWTPIAAAAIGAAVLSGWGAADATSPAPPWFPAQTATSEIPLDAAVDLAARRVPASDPPPRPV